MDSHNFDIIGSLPQEIAQLIFLFSSPEDLVNALASNSKWRFYTNNVFFWSQKCKRDNIHEKEEWLKSEHYKKYIENFPIRQKGIYLYDFYKFRTKLNWETGKYTKKTIRCDVKFVKIHYFDDEMIIATTVTDKIAVVDLAGATIARTYPTMEAHTNFCHILKSGDYLIYFSTSQYLTVWSLADETCLINKKFLSGVGGKKEKAEKIEVDKTWIGFIMQHGCCILNITTGQIEYETAEPVNCLAFHNNTIIFGTRDGTINFMEWHNRRTVTFPCCSKEEILKVIVKKESHGPVILGLCGSSEKTNPLKICEWDLTWNVKRNTLRHGGYFHRNNMLFDCNFREVPKDVLRVCEYRETYSFVSKYYGSNDNYIVDIVSIGEEKLICRKTGRSVVCFDGSFDFDAYGLPLMTNLKILLFEPMTNSFCILDFEETKVFL